MGFYWSCCCIEQLLFPYKFWIGKQGWDFLALVLGWPYIFLPFASHLKISSGIRIVLHLLCHLRQRRRRLYTFLCIFLKNSLNNIFLRSFMIWKVNLSSCPGCRTERFKCKGIFMWSTQRWVEPTKQFLFQCYNTHPPHWVPFSFLSRMYHFLVVFVKWHVTTSLWVSVSAGLSHRLGEHHGVRLQGPAEDRRVQPVHVVVLPWYFSPSPFS